MSDPIRVTLVVTPKGCPKCRQCQELVQRLQQDFPGQIDYVALTTEDDETQQFGVVLPPMLMVGDFMAAMGNVPIYEALAKLVATRLAKGCQ